MNSSLLNSLIEDNDEEIVEADVNTSDPNSTGTHDVGMNTSTDSLNSALTKAKAVTSAPTPTAKIGESEDVSTDDTMEDDTREEKLKKLFKIPPKELKLQVGKDNQGVSKHCCCTRDSNTGLSDSRTGNVQ